MENLKFAAENDNQDTEYVAPIPFEEWCSKNIERLAEDVEYGAKYLKDLGDDFVDRMGKLASEKQRMSEAELLKWEEDYASQWNIIERVLNTVDMNNSTHEAMVYQAKHEYKMFFSKSKDEDLRDTLEAQCGRFYRQRSLALREAIEKSNDEDKEADLKLLSGFYLAVYDHLDLKYLSKEDIRYKYGDNYKAYDDSRTAAHNNAIKHLNAINGLAKKYHTTPFTPRNFWTSEDQDQTVEMSKRMRFDRDAVEGFYNIAFSEEVRKREHKLSREIQSY
jgi:hypothetical protein